MSDRLVLITGGAGVMGRILVDREERPGWRYRLFDPIMPEPHPERDDIETVEGSVVDVEAVRRAMQGVTDVIHLGAVSVEDTWDEILAVNIGGTRTVLEAAREAGVGRFVFASSNHAVGGYTPRDAPEGGLADDCVPRPDTYYGWSKAAGEDLVRTYCERYPMRGVSIRIGHCFPEPLTGPRLSVWLSPRDARALVDAALEHDIEPYQVVWGVSANTRRWTSPDGGRRIGFEPVDDSERFAERFPDLPAAGVDPDEPLGAHFLIVPLGEPMRVR